MSTVLYILSREYLSVTLKKEKKLLKLVKLLTFLTQLCYMGVGNQINRQIFRIQYASSVLLLLVANKKLTTCMKQPCKTVAVNQHVFCHGWVRSIQARNRLFVWDLAKWKFLNRRFREVSTNIRLTKVAVFLTKKKVRLKRDRATNYFLSGSLLTRSRSERCSRYDQRCTVSLACKICNLSFYESKQPLCPIICKFKL